MKLVFAPSGFSFPQNSDHNVLLYNRSEDINQYGSVGAEVKNEFRRKRLHADQRAWDFLSIALAVVSADLAGHRKESPDGWTRDFDLTIAVSSPAFWSTQLSVLQSALGFLTTDRWRISFVEGGGAPPDQKKYKYPTEDCIVLLSGGLDSFIGAVDLKATGRKPFAVGQTVKGNRDEQKTFAANIGGGLPLLLLNHNANVRDPETPSSQRSRSIIFLAYGVAVATTLARYHQGETVQLFVCENGLISINPSLTGRRLGSMSTRTTHPILLRKIQSILTAAGIKVEIINPYQYKTKGEMMKECQDPATLKTFASQTTSCGRYLRFGHKHCGRCVPCQIRRAAFLAWGGSDATTYVFDNIGFDDKNYAGFDDVRSVAIALSTVKTDGLDTWLGAAINSSLLADADRLKVVVKNGIAELSKLHQRFKVK